MKSESGVRKLQLVKEDDEAGTPADLDSLIALIGYLEEDAKAFSALAAYFLARARNALVETTDVTAVETGPKS